MTDPAAPEPPAAGGDDVAAPSGEPATDASAAASVEGGASPAPAPPSPPWTPPETFADRFSRWSVAAVRGAVATFGLVSLVLFVLWLIPAVAVARSEAYRLARERVANDPMLQSFAGAPIECDRVPDWYDVSSPDVQRFRFGARGSSSSIEVEVVVRDGKAEIASAYLGGL